MKNYRWLAWFPLIGLLAACSSMNHSAPIVDRTTGVKPVAMFEGKPGYYIVKRGDTLTQIARTTRQKPADIATWNNLANPHDIKVDQVLRVAPPGAVAAAPVRSEPVPARAQAKAAPVVAAEPAVPGKTTPRGEKQPYSEATLAAMQKPEATATAVVVPVPKDGEKSALPPAATSEDDAVSWQWPTEGKILATFSEGKSRGIDIGGKIGQKVNAAANGKVIYAGAFRGYGNLVIVKHTENLLSAYAHNKAILVKQGDSVTKGQAIAEMGNSDSEVVKLHFEIRRQGGKPVDPSKFLPPR